MPIFFNVKIAKSKDNTQSEGGRERRRKAKAGAKQCNSVFIERKICSFIKMLAAWNAVLAAAAAVAARLPSESESSVVGVFALN